MAKKKVVKRAAGARKKKSVGKPSNLSVWQGVVAKAWKDKQFRERLMNDTQGVLAEHGFKAKKGVSYHVVADSKTVKHLIMPESARSVRVKPVRAGEPDPGF